MSPVALEPPYTTGAGRSGTPLTEGPALVRKPAWSRWHRVKSGVQHEHHDRPSWSLWCGQSANASGDIFTADSPASDGLMPDGVPVCGPCEGRAMGAGRPGTVTIAPDGVTVFVPDSTRKFRTPTRCPGTGNPAMVGEVTEPHDWRVIRCLACGALAVIGSGGGGYYTKVPGPREHVPHALPDPCPFHAWDRLTVRDGRPVCQCSDKAHPW